MRTLSYEAVADVNESEVKESTAEWQLYSEKRLAAQAGDDGTNDLIVSDVIRRNELQVWFVAEHVVDAPLTQAV